MNIIYFRLQIKWSTHFSNVLPVVLTTIFENRNLVNTVIVYLRLVVVRENLNVSQSNPVMESLNISFLSELCHFISSKPL